MIVCRFSRRRSLGGWLAAAAMLGLSLFSPVLSAVVQRPAVPRPELVPQVGTEHDRAAASLAFSPGGQSLAAGTDRTVRLWDLRTGSLRRTLGPQDGRILAVAYSPNGRMLASGGSSRNPGTTVMLWDPQTGARLGVLRLADGSVSSLAFSPDGEALAVGVRDDVAREMTLWDPRTGEKKWQTTEYTSFVQSLAFSPDGGLVATCGEGNAVRLWSARTGKLLRTLVVGSKQKSGVSVRRLARVAFSPDGKAIAAASDVGTVELLSAETGAQTRTLTGHESYVYGMAFSPDGKSIASGGYDGIIRAWDAGTGVEKWSRSYRRGDAGMAHLFSAAFSPDGRILASGGDGSLIRLSDAATGNLLLTLALLPTDDAREIPTEWIAFTPDGYYEGSAKAEGRIRWRVGGDDFPAEAYARAYHRPDLVQKALQRISGVQ